jgi:hypothetical protein
MVYGRYNIFKVLSIVLFFVIVFIESNIFSAECWEKYGLVPKGITLEGEAVGFPRIDKIEYDYSLNTFIINDDSRYELPVSPEEFLDIFQALQKDDRLGVSITLRKKASIIGRLSSKGKVVENLVEADYLLGNIVFGRTRWLRGVELPEKYRPKTVRRIKVFSVCYFNFEGYYFIKKDNVYRRHSSHMEISLIPVLKHKRAKNGGYLPDKRAIEKGLKEEAYATNADHIHKHMKKYMAMKYVNKANLYGEVAAFIRFLFKNQINKKALLEQIKKTPAKKN